MRIRKPKIRELGEAMRAILKGPFTTKFPFEPPNIIPEYRGFPEFDEDKCIRCGACAEVCPVNAIEVEEYEKDGKMNRKICLRYDICILCGQCVSHCTTGKGIIYTNKYSKNTLDRSEIINEVEDELVLCEKCGKVITTKKHLEWIADRIGEKAFANPTLMLLRYKEMGISPPDEEFKNLKEPQEFLREDTYKVLCPDCRRAAWMKENFQ
ncbi:MAG: 4Fe-4S binding protein [candidate division WOR-3 bacterium]|nr:4Fe-4S binding protein [candidate division WOR-3 bacterium]